MNISEDYIIRATAAEGRIRAFAATSRQTVEEARRLHNTSPVMTAALGRLLTAAGILGSQLKADTDKITLKIKGDGPAEALYAVAGPGGHVKGFAQNPQVLIHARADGKLDVGGAIGKGELTIIRDLGLKEPYVGTCALVSGEIAQDLTYYYAVSEQTPSSVSLGVLINKDNTVAQAGGFMIQLLPGVTEEEAAALEEKILAAPAITTMLVDGLDPEKVLERLLGDYDPQILEKTPLRFQCDCSRERMESVLIGLGRHDLLDLMVSQETVQVHCDYCNRYYDFDRPALKALFKKHFRGES